MLTVTENGKGRRSDIDTYRITARGGKGIRNYDASKDKVAAVKIVDDIDDVLLSSQEGIIIRLHANEIPLQSRYGSGAVSYTHLRNHYQYKCRYRNRPRV